MLVTFCLSCIKSEDTGNIKKYKENRITIESNNDEISTHDILDILWLKFPVFTYETNSFINENITLRIRISDLCLRNEVRESKEQLNDALFQETHSEEKMKRFSSIVKKYHFYKYRLGNINETYNEDNMRVFISEVASFRNDFKNEIDLNLFSELLLIDIYLNVIGKEEMGIAKLERIVEEYPDNVRYVIAAQYMLVDTLYRLDRKEEAEKAIKRLKSFVNRLKKSSYSLYLKEHIKERRFWGYTE